MDTEKRLRVKNRLKGLRYSFGRIMKDNFKMIGLVIAMTIISIGMIAIKLKDFSISLHGKKALLVFGIVILLTLVICGILYRAKKRKWKIEKVFLYCGLLLGTFYCVCLPLGSVPDEPVHFYRVYEISEGKILHPEGGSYMPSNMTDAITWYHDAYAYKNIIERITIKADTEQKIIASPDYAIINYIPQTIGVWIGKILQLPFLPMMLISRLFNMVFCIFIIYLCIKYIPFMKKTVFLIALFPMTMQLFASVSADSSIICAGIALITYVLYARNGMKRKLNFWDFVLLLIICLTLVITKPVYALLCPIVFWIPKERFKSKNQKLISIFLLGGLTLLVLVATRMSGVNISEGRFGSTGGQIDLILYNPLYYLYIIFRNIITLFDPYVGGVIGRSLEWLSLDIYGPYVLVLLIFFVLLCMERQKKIGRSLRIFAVLSFGALTIAVMTSMFILWSEPGSDVIEGVQGRYFLPFLLLIPLACLPSSGKIKKLELVKPKYLYVMTTLISVGVIGMIVSSHLLV